MSDRLEILLDEAWEKLAELVAIPSVSGPGGEPAAVREAARWLVEYLTELGWEQARLLEGPGMPVVTAQLSSRDPDAPCALLYGHYDVQPSGPPEQWHSPPFVATEADGFLYGRGTADDKGPILVHLAALRWLQETTGDVPVTVRLVLEGEEESGSHTLPVVLQEHADWWAADGLVVSDTSMLGEDTPSLCYGLRGICAVEVEVRTANMELHSGKFGGAAGNAAAELARLLAGLHDRSGRVAVEGFYDAVVEPDRAERERLAGLPFDAARWLEQAGSFYATGEQGFTLLEQTWLRPTCEIVGIIGGFTQEGIKTVVPAVAQAKLACRLVPDQQPEDIAMRLENYFRSAVSGGAQVEVRFVHGGPPFLSQVSGPWVRAAMAAFADGYGKTPFLTREGGSIPVVSTLVEVLQVPVVLLGFGLADQKEHAPNERFSLSNARKAVRTAASFWPHLRQELAAS